MVLTKCLPDKTSILTTSVDLRFYLKSNSAPRPASAPKNDNNHKSKNRGDRDDTQSKLFCFGLKISLSKSKNLNTTGTSYRQNLLLVLDETKVVDVVVGVVKF